MKLFFAVFCGLVAGLPCWADVTEAESLKGLDEIQLVVEELPDQALDLKLSKGILELEVTKQLQEGGITILSLDDRMAHPRRPYLYVNCNLLYIEQLDVTSFSIDVEVHQRVTLDTGEKAQGLTWAKSYLGMTSGGIAAERVRDTVRKFVAEFVEAVDAPDRAKSA